MILPLLSPPTERERKNVVPLCARADHTHHTDQSVARHHQDTFLGDRRRCPRPREGWRWPGSCISGTENEAWNEESSLSRKENKVREKAQAKQKCALMVFSLGLPAPPTTTTLNKQSSTQAWQGSGVGVVRGSGEN